MGGHTFAAVQNLHDRCRVGSFHLLANELIGCGIVVAFHLYVIVQADPDFLPLREHVGVRRQASQRGPIELLIPLRTRAGQFPERSPIQFVDQFPNRFVQLPQTEKLTLPEYGHLFPVAALVHNLLHYCPANETLDACK
jgi:hypothetical protein